MSFHLLIPKPPERIRIVQDLDPTNPLEEFLDGAVQLWCWHRRYNLGTSQPKWDASEFRWRLASDLVQFGCAAEDVPDEHIQRILDKHVAVLKPLYLYDHSGITIRTSSFNCRWDSGQVGWAFVTQKVCDAEFNGDRAAADRRLEAVVEEYDNYLTGAVYGYIHEQLIDGEWTEVDSCWGYFGHDPKENGIADEFPNWDKMTVVSV